MAVHTLTGLCFIIADFFLPYRALLALNWGSFIPQVRRLRRKRDSSGVSLTYVLFNLINATEQFAFTTFLTVNDLGGLLVGNPHSRGDQINLVQFAGVFFLWSLIFVSSVRFPSNDNLRGLKLAICPTIFILYLLFAVVPLFLQRATLSPGAPGDAPYEGWIVSWAVLIHQSYLFPLTSILCLASLIPQMHLIHSRRRRGSLSFKGLGIQGTVFSIEAVGWVGRLAFPWDDFKGQPKLNVLILWYQRVGWIPINYAFMALVQKALFWILILHRLHGNGRSRERERRPLLGW
ncbi:unnamed protein product [Clonostachys rosea f. rosea IK726]|uniref:Uncharacterized protein n=1 Tax=Clonostachys rosea f. rosea IK726 TaxID=1349383 RepID=A0ACA9TKY4_BIOOC|nr:unnamed protein product [Clonostachys rosea f. rosea IK726]